MQIVSLCVLIAVRNNSNVCICQGFRLSGNLSPYLFVSYISSSKYVQVCSSWSWWWSQMHTVTADAVTCYKRLSWANVLHWSVECLMIIVGLSVTPEFSVLHEQYLCDSPPNILYAPRWKSPEHFNESKLLIPLKTRKQRSDQQAYVNIHLPAHYPPHVLSVPLLLGLKGFSSLLEYFNFHLTETNTVEHQTC